MADSEAKRAWIKENTTPVMIKLNNNTDADIIAWLARHDNRQGYLKRLIREDIEREKSGK